jgi:hypothetical protein
MGRQYNEQYEILTAVYRITGQLTFKMADKVLVALGMWCGDRNIDAMVQDIKDTGSEVTT